MGFVVIGVFLGVTIMTLIKGGLSALTDISTWVGGLVVGIVGSTVANYIWAAVYGKDEADSKGSPPTSTTATATGVGSIATAVGSQQIHGNQVNVYNGPVNVESVAKPGAIDPVKPLIEQLEKLLHDGNVRVSAACLAAHALAQQLQWRDEVSWLEMELRGVSTKPGDRNIGDVLGTHGHPDNQLLVRILATRQVKAKVRLGYVGGYEELPLPWIIHEPIAELETKIDQIRGQNVDVHTSIPAGRLPGFVDRLGADPEAEVPVLIPPFEFRAIPGRVRTQLLDMLLKAKAHLR